ncbi:polymorphic toxin type 44 domain-containing protein [Tenacibaculum sp. 190524A05c]|uniref:Bacterial toxin 44 domain-containing protein n=1 Tax=Tenacibaculum platacis TaxID=3137852 RepID=A0ABM9P5S1_9FLAO
MYIDKIHLEGRTLDEAILLFKEELERVLVSSNGSIKENELPHFSFEDSPIITGTSRKLGGYYDSETGEYVHYDENDDENVYIRKTYKEWHNGIQLTFKKDILIGHYKNIPDKTDLFNEVLRETNSFFAKKNIEFQSKEDQILFGWGSKIKKRLDYFKSKIGYNKDYDIKSKKGNPFDAQKRDGVSMLNVNYYKGYAFYNNKLFRYDDFGNYNYGVAGKAFGFDDWVLKSAAGIAQVLNPGSPIGTVSSYLDDPKDQYMIMLGIEHWNNHFKK